MDGRREGTVIIFWEGGLAGYVAQDSGVGRGRPIKVRGKTVATVYLSNLEMLHSLKEDTPMRRRLGVVDNRLNW